MPSSFWERQRAKQQAQSPAVPVSSSQPWWARGTDILSQRQTVAQQPAQGRTGLSEQDPTKVEGHDVSKIGLLKGDAEECPVCPPDPRTGIRGNMYRISKNHILRCFDCGYKEDNRFRGETEGLIAIKEGPAYRARQTNSGGAVIHNYRGNISSAKEAVTTYQG
jgi:hypothetical protein